MKNDLLIGEKIKQIRSSKGISQENMARAIKSNQSYVYRLELGQAECSTEMLAAIKKFLEIENAPLLEHEINIYRQRIWVWDSLLDVNRLEDAKEMQSEMSSVLKLPYEQDLHLLFTMVMTRLLLREHNFPKAEELMNNADTLIENASNDALFMYHRNKGAIYAYRGDNKNGLKHSLQAINIKGSNIKPDGIILSNIGVLYLGLGRPYHAMKYLERALEESRSSHTHFYRSHISTALASLYTFMGEHTKAKELFDESLNYAVSSNNVVQRALAMSNLGLFYIKIGKYEEGVELCNQALEYMQDSGLTDKRLTTNKGFSSSPQYKIVLFNKGLGLLKMKEFAKCQEVAAQGKALADGDEKASTMFDTLMHFTNLGDSSSEKHIENVAIPYFRAGDGFDRLLAIDLCKDLETHYRKKRAMTKAFAIATIARDIYEEMFIGEIVL